MKRTVVFCALAVAASLAMAGTISWDNSAAIVGPDGNVVGWDLPMGTASDWLVQLMTPVGAVDTGLDVLGGDDTVIDPPAGWSPFADGFWAGGPSGQTGGDMDVYVRVFNTATPTVTDQYALLFGAGKSMGDLYHVPLLPEPISTHSFDPGGAAQGDWQPIPEPGTLALFGLGLLTIVVRRRLRK
jgi:hypothetical protein